MDELSDLTPAPAPRPPLLRRRAATVAVLTGLGIGGLVGGYVISHAATTVATATPSPSSGATGAPDDGGRGPHPNIPGGRGEDLQVAATAIGVSLGDLQSALQNGQSIAAVAKAHNVDAGKVISALVASEDKEIDSAQSAGSITSAQATQLKAGVQQRVTDLVNGTGHGPGGPGGPCAGHGMGRPGVNGAAGAPGGFFGGGSA